VVSVPNPSRVPSDAKEMSMFHLLLSWDLCEFFITFCIAAVVHSQNSIGFPLFLQ
jgi:hypothetical protein